MDVKLTSLLLKLIAGDKVKVEEKGGRSGGKRLCTKVQVCSNDQPAFYDNSGTIATRFYYLQFKKSFLGAEDLELADRLLEEAPGILNWAIDGLHRLAKQRRFTEPSRHQELQKEFKEGGSTILAFARDQLTLGGNRRAHLESLYLMYIRWAKHTSRKGEYNYENFCSKFRSAFPELEITRPRTTAGRLREVHGVGIRDWLGRKRPRKGRH